MNLELEDKRINIKLKLALLWVSFMFLYIYVDYFHLYMPNSLGDIIKGKVFVFSITQEFLLIALSTISIPILMIYFSLILPARANRWINIVVAFVYIPYTLFNLVGDMWIHMILAAIIEVFLLCAIIYHSLKWA
jgi:hypothetical protein